MTARSDALDLAVLGLLHEAPMHGYELRKRVTGLLGWGRVLSYGSLYPCLKQLLRDGLIADDQPDSAASDRRTGRRAKIVYRLTADGKERFDALVSAAGPSAWDDDGFGVHFAFFGLAAQETRIRILEGRRSRLEDRLDAVRNALARSRERLDTYTLELQRHGQESVEREVRWLTELIDNERGATPGRFHPSQPVASEAVAQTAAPKTVASKTAAPLTDGTPPVRTDKG
jgi:DNA-binding PadR family transcriptional regulator